MKHLCLFVLVVVFLAIVSAAYASEPCPLEPPFIGVSKITGPDSIGGTLTTRISNASANKTHCYRAGSAGDNGNGTAEHTNEFFMTVDDPCSTTGGTCKWKIKWKFEVTCTRLFAKAHVYGAESRARGFARVILNGETEQDSKSASAEYGPTGEEMSEEDQEHASNGGISVDHSGHKLSVTEEDEKGILAHMSCTVPTNSFFEVENFAYGEGEAIYSDATWTKINVELVSGTCGG